MPVKKVELARKRGDVKKEGGRWTGWQVDIRDASGRRLRTTFQTKAAAEEFEQTVRDSKKYVRAGVRAPVVRQNIQLSDLIDARIESLNERKQVELERRVLNYFRDLVGEKRVEDITLTDLRSFVKTRAKELTVRNVPVKPQTVDRELTIIAATLHAAPQLFDELRDYVAPRIPHPKFKRGRRERVITVDESEALLSHLWQHHPYLGRIFEFALLTGLRHTEIMKLRPTAFDRKKRTLTVERFKTGTVSTLSPLTDRMVELLRDPVGEYIFTPDGRTPSQFYKHLRAACSALNIPYGRYREGGLVLHDARHTWITKMTDAGIDLATIAGFSGHSTKEMVLHYSHAGPESRRRAMAVVDDRPRDLSKALRGIYNRVRNKKITLDEFTAEISKLIV